MKMKDVRQKIASLRPQVLGTVEDINKMMDAGVRVFKIEGRARGPEYVRIVAECYREAIESVRSERRFSAHGRNR